MGQQAAHVKNLYMKKKLVLLLIVTLFFHIGHSQNNTDRIASFLQYGQYLQPYLELQHNYFYKGELDSLHKDFKLVITFQIDTDGQIINYKNQSDSLPELVKQYVNRLIYLTTGRWKPEVKNCSLRVSDTIKCYVYLKSKKISLNDRMNNLEEEIKKKFFSNEPSPPNLVLSELNDPNHCAIFLNY